MNKKFKFKLEGLKKLREFKEQTAKIELGMINKEIADTQEEIKLLHQFIDVGYDSQNESLEDGMKGYMLKFYPLYTEGLHAHIERLENHLYSLRNKYQEKLEELYKKMGDSKLINKLKTKAHDEHKRELNKKMEEDLQDLHIISGSSKKAG